MVPFDSISQKRLSFILVTKNRASSLDKALKRTTKLLHKNDELIVIDGGSTDETLEVIRKYRNIMNVFVSEKDKGIGEANNKGILLATGRYVKNISDDDIFYPKALEKAVHVLDKNPDVDLLVCGGVKKQGRNKNIVYLPPGTDYGESVLDVLKYGSCGSGFIIRRSAFAKANLFPMNLTADVSIVLEFISKGLSVKFCRLKLFLHSVDKDSSIISKKNAWDQERKILFKKYFTTSDYYRFILRDFLSYHPINLKKTYKKLPLLKKITYPLKPIYNKLFNLIILQKHSTDSQKKNNIIWDGGFS